MEETSAFAAYQAVASKKAANNKTKSDKKQKNLTGRAQFVVPVKTQKKRKQANPPAEEPANKAKASPSTVFSAIKNHNGHVASVDVKKKKKKLTPKSPVIMNGSPGNHQNQAPSQTPSRSPSTSSNNDITASSVQKGLDAFSYLLSGVEVKTFMTHNWEKESLFIQRDNPQHFDQLQVSTDAIDEMLRNNNIEYTKNLDVTSYVDGVRETHNPEGRALPPTVWGHYQDGCSVRLINPQTFMAPLHKLCETLQEYFHCLVGANIYLTPPNSQGFAPHYDDIEAFVLQIEGQKEWFLYPPRTTNEILPRESSNNFNEDEIGEPCFTKILNPGDSLYFPRGWIHQAKTIENSHSLHITLSVYQKNSFAELFEELTKQALKTAIESNERFRRGLPIDIWNHFGQTYASYDMNPRRNSIKDHISNLFRMIGDHLDVDDAVDKLAIKYHHDALPPVLSTAESLRTIHGTKPILYGNGEIEMPQLGESTQVRLIRAHIIRLTYIDGVYRIYYHADNSKEYHGGELTFMELVDETVEAIKKLIALYPKYIKVQDLSEDIELAMGVAENLWDHGLLMTKSPLQ